MGWVKDLTIWEKFLIYFILFVTVLFALVGIVAAIESNPGGWIYQNLPIILIGIVIYIFIADTIRAIIYFNTRDNLIKNENIIKVSKKKIEELESELNRLKGKK